MGRLAWRYTLIRMHGIYHSASRNVHYRTSQVIRAIGIWRGSSRPPEILHIMEYIERGYLGGVIGARTRDAALLWMDLSVLPNRVLCMRVRSRVFDLGDLFARLASRLLTRAGPRYQTIGCERPVFITLLRIRNRY